MLEATFTRFVIGLPEPERPLWRVTVSSVPSNLRSWVKQGLVESGLPRMRAWLLQPFSSTAVESAPHCNIMIQAEQRRLLLERRDSGFDSASVEELPVSAREV